MSERLAGLPRSWGRLPTSMSRLRQPRAAFWILAAIFAVAAVMTVVQYALTFVGPNAPFALTAMAVWGVWTLLGAWLVGLIDVYRHVPWSVRVAALAWGAFVTLVVSGPLVGLISGLVGPALGDYTSVVSSPLAEESMKLLGVILIAATVPVLFRRPVTGLVCGMLVGLGFSFVENWGFTNGMVSEGMANAGTGEKFAAIAGFVFQRGFLAGAWAHLAFTGLASMGIVYFASRHDRGIGRRVLGAAGFFLGAIVLHTWNNLGTSISGGMVQIVVYGGAVIAQLIVLVWLIVHTVRAERRWLSTAGADAAPVVEAAEVTSLRKRRTRRRARASLPDSAGRARARYRQWAQIGYVDALAESAPDRQTDRLASYVALLREPVGAVGVPRQRSTQPSWVPEPGGVSEPGEDQRPTTGAPG